MENNTNKWSKEQKHGSLRKMELPISKEKQPLAENSSKTRKKKDEDQEFKLNNSILTQIDSKGRRYPKRQVGIKNYKEIDEPQEDRYVFCDFCQETFLDCCPKCGQLAFLQDTVVKMGIENRAKLTLPSNFVQILPSKIHGLGVFAKVTLKKGIKMGPYQGITTRVESTLGYSWKLRDGFLVDAGDEKNSNWMRYVNCARHFKEQNLMAFQYKGELYYRTCQDIEPGQELLVYYGNHFAMNLGIDVKSYFRPKEDNIVEDGRYCQFCRIGYRDSSRLDNHIILCKLNPANFKKPPEKIFTCRFCSIGITDEEYFVNHEKRCEKRCERNKENINRSNIVQRNIKQKCKKRTELGEKKFKCSKCEYTTKQTFNLKKHERTHSDKLLLVCSVAKKVSTAMWN
ncbi:hypothetical protein WA026_011426 [Henosepilachna vigintioctopunctata]|uniref:Histone-lysine N-methyltransferase PRDM9 n=1 Tax=Henosepilachna vigintioctopunctata TaxID=420089 RepID=A0AAW1TKS1_9CUCU